MKKTVNGLIAIIGFAILLMANAEEVVFNNQPIDVSSAVKPNVIFALDDSGSMDFEVLLTASDGSLWWNSTTRRFVDAQGEIYYNQSGSTGYDNGDRWYKYVYLFPNGTGSDKRKYSDGTYGYFAIPPTPEFAFMRSAAYNTLYYNHEIDYNPWRPAYINNQVVEFDNANPVAALSHPVFSNPVTGHKLNLTQIQFSLSSNKTFRMKGGMSVPGGDIPGIKRRSGWKWKNVSSNTSVPSNSTWTVAIPYYPATYYVVDSTCTSGTECFSAYDGQPLRRVEIKPGNQFPSGRSYQDELQNFANWYTYYRKRKLMMAGSMGHILTLVRGVYGSVVLFNDRDPATMYDFDGLNPASNKLRLLGEIYQNPSYGGTPTRTVLDYVGQQFQNNHQIITKACQKNAAVVLTDGFASTSGPTPPSYNAATFGSGAPYQTTYAKSLADIALAYYTTNLRPDLAAGKVPVGDVANPFDDHNPNLHMNTLALTIGPTGTIYGTNSPSSTNPYLNPPTWPNPNISYSPTSIDDLWHATVNGRGVMGNAANPIDLAATVRDIMYDILTNAHASSSVGLEDVYMSNSNNAIYAASHHIGFGELKKYNVNLTNGNIQTGSLVWSANAQLEAKAPGDRLLATYNGTAGIPFRYDQLPTGMRAALLGNVTQLVGGVLNHLGGYSGNPSNLFTAENTVGWMRYEPGLPDSVYRTRAKPMGSIVHASPVVVAGALKNYADPGYEQYKAGLNTRTKMVYQAANDGMLHAFDATTGEERWAYIPHAIFHKLPLLADINFVHEFTVDATPSVNDVKIANQWKTMLLGGYGAGGRGYYAFDITSPDAVDEAALASKVLWEFPNALTPTATIENIGLTFGTPKAVKTKAAGWVVLVTSGYNNTAGDGQGHLFVLDPLTGSVIKDLSTGLGSASVPSGLAHISVYADNPKYDPIASYAYGGDLEGNVWRFDLSGDSVNDWNVSKLAQLVDAAGNPQPVTTEPELAEYSGQRVVYVGTGRLLTENDVSALAPQSVYALLDTDNPSTRLISPLRSNLTSVADTTDSGDRGWYLDLQAAGERINTMPILALDTLVFSANKPSPDGCSSEQYQYRFALGMTTGNAVTADDSSDDNTIVALPKPTFVRQHMGNTLSSSPALAMLPNDTLVAITQNSDATFTTTEVATQTGTSSSKAIAWREVLRD